MVEAAFGGCLHTCSLVSLSFPVCKGTPSVFSWKRVLSLERFSFGRGHVYGVRDTCLFVAILIHRKRYALRSRSQVFNKNVIADATTRLRFTEKD